MRTNLQEFRDIILEILINNHTREGMSNKTEEIRAYDEQKIADLLLKEMDESDNKRGNLLDIIELYNLECETESDYFNKQLMEKIIKRMRDLGKISDYFPCNLFYMSDILKVASLKFPFVICFTKKEDDRFLWDSYTNNEGVCLEIDRKKLQTFLEEKYRINEGYDYYYRDICYQDKEQYSKIIETQISCYKEGVLEKYNVDSDEFTELSKFYNASNLSVISSLFKNSFWFSEDEVRLVFPISYFQESYFYPIKENYNLKYKNGYCTQDYIEVNIPRDVVTKIIIGPNNSKQEVEKILESGSYVYNEDFLVESKGTGVIKK